MINSPCIKICKLNEDKVCIGCYRTIDEITGWKTFTETEKQSVLTRIKQAMIEEEYKLLHDGTKITIDYVDPQLRFQFEANMKHIHGDNWQDELVERYELTFPTSSYTKEEIILQYFIKWLL